jgi:hypothetical protein
MGSRAVTLEAAAFLDSPEARALDGLEPGRIRFAIEAFLQACLDDLGKRPKLLDGEDVRTLLRDVLPGYFLPQDDLADEVPRILRAYFAHLGTTQVVSNPFEVERALEDAGQSFPSLVRASRVPPRTTRRAQEPFVHGAEKLGRNDPCSCGSGKKFKKCHGKSG